MSVFHVSPEEHYRELKTIGQILRAEVKKLEAQAQVVADIEAAVAGEYILDKPRGRA